ncbi:hypothetical protein HZA75_00940 [Candidatus Roizmanbacteria bacterium]|nr:hypothetical protein [Candidatus Roizmanbacteria bacterium]
MSDKNLIKVQVLTTEAIVFEGEIDRITSFNEVGLFDVYPMHANFISIIEKKVHLYHQKKIIKELEFEKAVMKVKQDIVYIFLGIEVLFLDDENQLTSPKSSAQK